MQKILNDFWTDNFVLYCTCKREIFSVLYLAHQMSNVHNKGVGVMYEQGKRIG